MLPVPLVWCKQKSSLLIYYVVPYKALIGQLHNLPQPFPQTTWKNKTRPKLYYHVIFFMKYLDSECDCLQLFIYSSEHHYNSYLKVMHFFFRKKKCFQID